MVSVPDLEHNVGQVNVKNFKPNKVNICSSSKGFNGRMCILRSICEAAEVQFSEHLMAELFHVFFT